MTSRMLTGLAWLTLACSGPESKAGDIPADVPEFEPPVALNADPPVRYPPDLYRRRVEGTVILHLFVREDGSVVPDSTRIEQGSGHAVLDSAAVAGVVTMRFAPARRKGVPVASPFLQPIHFRHPDTTAPGGGRP